MVAAHCPGWKGKLHENLLDGWTDDAHVDTVKARRSLSVETREIGKALHISPTTKHDRQTTQTSVQTAL